MLNETGQDVQLGKNRPEGAPGQPLGFSFSQVPVTVEVLLGSSKVPLSEMLALQAGALITLDQQLGAPVTLIVNGCAIARGELYVLEGDGDKIGVKILELMDTGGVSVP